MRCFTILLFLPFHVTFVFLLLKKGANVSFSSEHINLLSWSFCYNQQKAVEFMRRTYQQPCFVKLFLLLAVLIIAWVFYGVYKITFCQVIVTSKAPNVVKCKCCISCGFTEFQLFYLWYKSTRISFLGCGFKRVDYSFEKLWSLQSYCWIFYLAGTLILAKDCLSWNSEL